MIDDDGNSERVHPERLGQLRHHHARRGAQRVLLKVIGGNKQPSADCHNSEF